VGEDERAMDGMKTPSSLELMRARVEAHYTHDHRSRIESIRQWDGGIAPRFYLLRTAVGTLSRFRSDLPDDLVAQLRELCDEEPMESDVPRSPSYEDEYLRLLTSEAPIERIWRGPAYVFATEVSRGVQAIAIQEENVDLLRGGLEDWIPDVPHRRPFMAMLENARAVSVCASVRITDEAHEAGVETLPAYRRRGHALRVVSGWAAAVRKLGAVPFYSTSWDNVASQSLAARLGLPLFGVDFHIT
jgi:hypothetical protein